MKHSVKIILGTPNLSYILLKDFPSLKKKNKEKAEINNAEAHQLY